jgi:virginiamycin B lyase
MFKMVLIRRGVRTTVATLMVFSIARADAADALTSAERRPIGELNRTAVIHLGKTADWVSITPDAVWVGSTGPFAVHRIDPKTNRRIATVRLPGEPCAGLAIGFDSLWVPLCGAVPLLAKVDLKSNQLVSVFKTGPCGCRGWGRDES